jgi:hypothetical protein
MPEHRPGAEILSDVFREHEEKVKEKQSEAHARASEAQACAAKLTEVVMPVLISVCEEIQARGHSAMVIDTVQQLGLTLGLTFTPRGETTCPESMMEFVCEMDGSGVRIRSSIMVRQGEGGGLGEGHKLHELTSESVRTWVRNFVKTVLQASRELPIQ